MLSRPHNQEVNLGPGEWLWLDLQVLCSCSVSSCFSKVDQLPVKRLIDSRFLLLIPDDADRSHILLIVSWGCLLLLWWSWWCHYDVTASSRLCCPWIRLVVSFEATMLTAMRWSDWSDANVGRGWCLVFSAMAGTRRWQQRIQPTMERMIELSTMAAPLREKVAM